MISHRIEVLIREYRDENGRHPTKIYLDLQSFNLLWEEVGDPSQDEKIILLKERPFFKGVPVYIVLTNLNIFVAALYKYSEEHIFVA